MEVSTSFGFCFNNNLNSSAHPCTSPTMKRGSFVVTVMCLLDIGNAVAIIRARAPCGFKKKVERGGGGWFWCHYEDVLVRMCKSTLLRGFDEI